MLVTGLTDIDSIYITKQDIGALTLTGMQQLSTLDPDITVEGDKRRIEAAAERQPHRERDRWTTATMPAPSNGAVLPPRSSSEARAKSAKISAAGNEKIYEADLHGHRRQARWVLALFRHRCRARGQGVARRIWRHRRPHLGRGRRSAYHRHHALHAGRAAGPEARRRHPEDRRQIGRWPDPAAGRERIARRGRQPRRPRPCSATARTIPSTSPSSAPMSCRKR